MSRFSIKTSTRVDVECAIARGWRIERICTGLDVAPEIVQAVWNDLDALDIPEVSDTAARVAANAFKVWQAVAAQGRRRLAKHQEERAA